MDDVNALTTDCDWSLGVLFTRCRFVNMFRKLFSQSSRIGWCECTKTVTTVTTNFSSGLIAACHTRNSRHSAWRWQRVERMAVELFRIYLLSKHRERAKRTRICVLRRFRVMTLHRVTSFKNKIACRGGTKKKWDECSRQDLRTLNLKAEWAQDRTKWRSSFGGNRPTWASMEKRTLNRWWWWSFIQF